MGQADGASCACAVVRPKRRTASPTTTAPACRCIFRFVLVALIASHFLSEPDGSRGRQMARSNLGATNGGRPHGVCACRAARGAHRCPMTLHPGEANRAVRLFDL